MAVMNSIHLSGSQNSIKLLKCRKCSTITTNKPELHPSFCHCMTCLCSNPDCTEFWYICPLHSVRFASTKYSKMRTHFITIDHDIPHGFSTISHDEEMNNFNQHKSPNSNNTDMQPMCSYQPEENECLSYPESKRPKLNNDSSVSYIFFL